MSKQPRTVRQRSPDGRDHVRGPPRANQILCAGVLAGNAASRAEVVPSTQAEREARSLKLVKAEDRRETTARAEERRRWAELLHRVFEVDGWACPHSSGRHSCRTQRRSAGARSPRARRSSAFTRFNAARASDSTSCEDARPLRRRRDLRHDRSRCPLIRVGKLDPRRPVRPRALQPQPHSPVGEPLEATQRERVRACTATGLGCTLLMHDGRSSRLTPPGEQMTLRPRPALQNILSTVVTILLVLHSADASAACPGPYAGKTCNGGTGSNICSFTSTTVTCSFNDIAGTQGADGTFFNTSNTGLTDGCSAFATPIAESFTGTIDADTSSAHAPCP